MSAAKEQHIDAGGEWPASLQLAANRFHHSTLRGIGPPRQSEPLNFSLLLLLSFGWLPIVTGGPCNTMAVIVLFTMFLLREIEGALAERGHVQLDHDQATVTWSLPASKTDPQARGCTRTWGVHVRYAISPGTGVPLPHHVLSLHGVG